MPYLVEIFEAQRETLYDQSTGNTGGTIFGIQSDSLLVYIKGPNAVQRVCPGVYCVTSLDIEYNYKTVLSIPK